MYLKGEDAEVYQSCQELELNPVLQMIYSQGWSGGSPSSHSVMMKTIVHNPYYDQEQTDYGEHLVKELGGVPVNMYNGVLVADSEWTLHWHKDELMERCEQLTWLTDFTKSANQLKDIEVTFGNDVSVGFVYCSPCLIARIRPTINRM